MTMSSFSFHILSKQTGKIIQRYCERSVVAICASFDHALAIKAEKKIEQVKRRNATRNFQHLRIEICIEKLSTFVR